jgi:hypothetical protein
MKILKPIITLACLIALLISAIREKQTTIEIINNLSYHDERLQNKKNTPLENKDFRAL